MYQDDYDILTLFNVRDKNNKNDLNLGLARGTIFSSLYQPYQDYQVYGLKGTTELDRLKLRIYELSFAINDLNLYLDIHDDPELYEKFKEYTKLYKSLVDDYEKIVGPICLTDSDYKNFKWVEDPWPWQNEMEAKYV